MWWSFGVFSLSKSAAMLDVQLPGMMTTWDLRHQVVKAYNQRILNACLETLNVDEDFRKAIRPSPDGSQLPQYPRSRNRIEADETVSSFSVIHEARKTESQVLSGNNTINT